MWLPPTYGKVRYDDMDEESRRVVDEFQGREKYDEVNLSVEGGLGGKEQAGSRQDSRGRDCRASVSVDYNG